MFRIWLDLLSPYSLFILDFKEVVLVQKFDDVGRFASSSDLRLKDNPFFSVRKFPTLSFTDNITAPDTAILQGALQCNTGSITPLFNPIDLFKPLEDSEGTISTS